MLIRTNRLNLPDFVVDALTYDHYQGSKADNAISVTTLIDSPYYTKLAREHGRVLENPTDKDRLYIVTEDVADRMWAMLGSIGHSICERVASDRYTKEERLEYEIEYINYQGKDSKTTLSGQYDIFDVEEGILYDNKYTTQWALVYNPKGKREWIEQMNVYAWLFWKVKGIQVKGLKVVAWIKDSMAQDKLKEGRPSEDINVVDIKLWDLEFTEQFIFERLRYHSSAPLLTECTVEERWSKAPKFAVMGTGKRALKLYDKIEDAMQHVSRASAPLSIESRPGEDTRCDRYCNYTSICDFYKQKQKGGLFNG